MQEGCPAEVALALNSGTAADDEPRLQVTLGIVEALQRAGVRALALDSPVHIAWKTSGGVDESFECVARGNVA